MKPNPCLILAIICLTVSACGGHGHYVEHPCMINAFKVKLDGGREINCTTYEVIDSANSITTAEGGSAVIAAGNAIAVGGQGTNPPDGKRFRLKLFLNGWLQMETRCKDFEATRTQIPGTITVWE